MSRQAVIDRCVDEWYPHAPLTRKEWAWLRDPLTTDTYRECADCHTELGAANRAGICRKCRRARERDAVKHPCVDCGMSVHGVATRCKACALADNVSRRYLKRPGRNPGWPWPDDYQTPYTGCSDACRCAR